MTDATAQKLISEKFGPLAYGEKLREFDTGRLACVQIRNVFGPSLHVTIGAGPTWEHAINEALAWKAKQR